MGRLETALGLAMVLAALGGCATRPSGPVPKPAPPPAPSPPVPAQAAQAEKPLPPPKPAPDPIVALIAESQARFETGQRELAVGHLERARREFDAAIDVLVQSPYGARYDARLREQFERLIDRISAYEMTALAEGDGFTEKRYEPASIDALLEESTFATAAASAKTEETVASDLARTPHDVPIPQNDAGARLHRAVPGTPARVVPDQPPEGRAVPSDDPGRLPGRGPSARPGVRADRRERLQARRLVTGQGQGGLAVHGRDRRRERTQTRLVRRRAVRPREGHPRGGGVSPGPCRAPSTATGTSRSRRTTAALGRSSAR